jgi:pantetheine-phosphate adenylyltransferase
MSLIALYPGSFDPFTNGHFGVTERCLKVFDKVIIGIAQNSRKEPFFEVEERIDMICGALSHNPRVEVLAFKGLTVNFAAKCGASVIVRGLRAVADFEYELQMANTNRKLNSKVETLFMMTSEEYFFVSSQNVKEVASLGGNISGLVPQIIAKRVLEKLKSMGHIFPKD